MYGNKDQEKNAKNGDVKIERGKDEYIDEKKGKDKKEEREINDGKDMVTF